MHLDLTHLGEEKIDKRLPMVRELSKIYVGVDPVHEPIPIRPVVHYMMGGVDTDIDGATTHARPLRRRRDRLRVAERREPAGLELAHRVPGLRRARGASTPCSSRRAPTTATRTPASAGRGGGRAHRGLRGKQKGGEKLAQIRAR